MNELPDRIGVVSGYRRWRALPHMPLASIGQWVEWRLDGATEARCGCIGKLGLNLWCGKAPGPWGAEGEPAHRCGLYAYYVPQSVPPPASPRHRGGSTEFIVGSVIAWGKIVHHETFFRAERMLPVAFMRPGLEDFEHLVAVPSERLEAPILDTFEELCEYTEEEVSKW